MVVTPIVVVILLMLVIIFVTAWLACRVEERRNQRTHRRTKKWRDD